MAQAALAKFSQVFAVIAVIAGCRTHWLAKPGNAFCTVVFGSPDAFATSLIVNPGLYSWVIVASCSRPNGWRYICTQIGPPHRTWSVAEQTRSSIGSLLLGAPPTPSPMGSWVVCCGSPHVRLCVRGARRQWVWVRPVRVRFSHMRRTL